MFAVVESPRLGGMKNRMPWDTDALRQRACTVHNSLAALADADPDGDKRERARADMIPPLSILRSWRLQRLARRYPEVRVVLDKLTDQAIEPGSTYYQSADGRQYQRYSSEPIAERKARRAKHVGPNAAPVYGRLSKRAEREAIAEYRLRRMRAGHFACRYPGGPGVTPKVYEKKQRYPRYRVNRWWMAYLDDTKAGDRHLLCYGFRKRQQHKFEIVTAEDRVRRHAKRIRKALTRAAGQVAQTAEGLQALEAVLAAARKRMGK